MERGVRSFQRAPKESETRARKNLKEARKEAVLILKQHVVLALIRGAQHDALHSGSPEQAGLGHGELPYWGDPHNHDDLIPFAAHNADNVAAQRKQIIKGEILPRKKKLGIPPFEKRQHALVRNKMKDLAKELGVSEELVLEIADVQMQAAVNLQKRKIKKSRKDKPAQSRDQAA